MYLFTNTFLECFNNVCLEIVMCVRLMKKQL